jgi:hypothetical protein
VMGRCSLFVDKEELLLELHHQRQGRLNFGA